MQVTIEIAETELRLLEALRERTRWLNTFQTRQGGALGIADQIVEQVLEAAKRAGG